MSQRFESTFTGFDRNEIFFQAWTAKDPRGTIVVTHGLAEHSECYNEFAQNLNQSSWDVYIWDLPGHGRSAGKRGYISDFEVFVDDFKIFVDLVNEERASELPLVMFGHSMGGLITLKALCRDKNPVQASALILSSPAMGYAIKVSAVKNKLAHIANKWMPTLTLFNEIKYADLSRDQDKIDSYCRDSLRHDKISPAIYLGMQENFEYVLDHVDRIQLPTMMQLAGIDRIVSTPKSRELYEQIPAKRKRLEVYPDSYHEVFNDLDKEKCYEDLKDFLKGVS